MNAPISRDQKLDTFKGLLTFLMVYCHVLQFFGDSSLSPQNEYWIQAANLLVFPGFLFAFGQNVQRSYYSNPIIQAASRMLKGALRLYAVFVFSGLGFRVLRENRPLRDSLLRRIILLQDIPGWSEFIIAFAIFFLAALLLYYPMNKWKGLVFPLLLGMFSLLAAFVPYGLVNDPRVQLLIGGRGFASFPVAQYLAYFCLGIAFSRMKGQKKPMILLLILCSALSVAGLWRTLSLGALPERFPPDIGWLLLPFLPLILLYLLSAGLETVNLPLPRRALGFSSLSLPLSPIRSLGRHSMLHLLLSNLLIFTMAGKDIVPQLNSRSFWLFALPIQTASGAFRWTLALLVSISVVCSFATKQLRVKHIEKRKTP